MTRCIRWMAALSACLTVLSCSSLFGPDLPEGTVPLTPLPAEYEGWWALMQRCSGREGRLDDVEWLVLPNVNSIPGTEGADGIYSERDHAIVLTGRSVAVGPLVRHEMLHALLRDGFHRRSAFVSSCGGIVSCGTVCTEEAGGALVPTSLMPHLDPSTIEVEVDLEPTVARGTDGTEGCVTIVVGVRNLEGRPVRAFVLDETGQGFYWSVEGVGRGTDTQSLEGDYIAFEAGGTRRRTFDCPPLIKAELAPGDYTIRGEFHGVVSDATHLTVVP